MSDPYRALSDEALQSRMLPYLLQVNMGRAMGAHVVNNLSIAWTLPDLSSAIGNYAEAHGFTDKVILRVLTDLPPQQAARLLCEFWLGWREGS